MSQFLVLALLLQAANRKVFSTSVSFVENLVGPTECTVASNVHVYEKGDAACNIGKPISGACSYVLDDKLNPLPIGAPGMLWIGGSGVGRGYWNRPELSETKFISNPFRPGTRMYKTVSELSILFCISTLDFLFSCCA